MSDPSKPSSSSPNTALEPPSPRLPPDRMPNLVRHYADALFDIEDSNDESLEHTRNGWLRFVVCAVKSMDTYETEPEQTIEIEVIDKSRMPHKLMDLPQPKWKKNSWHNPEQVFQAEWETIY